MKSEYPPVAEFRPQGEILARVVVSATKDGQPLVLHAEGPVHITLVRADFVDTTRDLLAAAAEAIDLLNATTRDATSEAAARILRAAIAKAKREE